jgi:hypothetical protein
MIPTNAAATLTREAGFAFATGTRCKANRLTGEPLKTCP